MKSSTAAVLLSGVIAIGALAFAFWQVRQRQEDQEKVKMLAVIIHNLLWDSKTFCDNLTLSGEKPTDLLADRQSLMVRWHTQLLHDVQLPLSFGIWDEKAQKALLWHLNRPADDILPEEMMPPVPK
jgi:hypothetical protein